MIIGIPKEIKVHEYRVGATPAIVRTLVEHGHELLVQSGAGEKIGFSDSDYRSAGARLALSAQDVYAAEMVIKIKEPQEAECLYMHPGQIFFCYLHLAPNPELTARLLERQVVGIAYETVVGPKGGLPLLLPMSEIAGRLAIQAAAAALQLNQGGKGILLGGTPGVPSAYVVVLGGGAAGTEAARMALGLGAQVVVLDRDIERLRHLDMLFGPALRTLYSHPDILREEVRKADLLIGAVLIPGKTAPKLVSREMVRSMGPGSVIVDISIDQGGCVETARPTTYAEPTFMEEGVVHYCVTNMPGACAKTSTLALTQATGGYALAIANKGYAKALMEDPGLGAGLNVCLGSVTNPSVAQDLGYQYVPVDKVLSSY
jgi:alanine dehydrogenase